MKIRILSAAIVVSALLLVPAPILPPHRLAEVLESLSRVDWKVAYLITVFALQFTFYGCLGMLAGFSITRAVTLAKRILQIALLPLGLVALSLVIRSVKVGHPPVWVNAVVPILGCVAGTAIGLGLLYRRGKIALALVVLVVGISLGALLPGTSSELRVATERHLQRIVSAGPSFPSGDARFGALLQSAFASVPGESNYLSAVQQNRAAILAWGISVGYMRLARFVGLDPNSELVRNASALGETVTLRGRNDWPKHYAVSAALAVLEHPGISEAGALMKEQLDALTRGSGFSFGDLAADRAGVRFAFAATSSESAARAMQARLRTAYAANDLFPSSIDFPENLTVEEFRREFEGVGSRKYRQEVRAIESQLDTCVALSTQ